MYYGHGFTYSDVMEMTTTERTWFLQRLEKQKAAEDRLRRKK